MRDALQATKNPKRYHGKYKWEEKNINITVSNRRVIDEVQAIGNKLYDDKLDNAELKKKFTPDKWP